MNNQNESPFGNPRFIGSIILVFLFLWGWQYYVNKTYPPAVKKNQVIEQKTANGPTGGTSTGTVPNAPLDAPDAKTALNPAPAEQTYQYEDENVKWEISSKGTALVNYHLKKYLDKERKPIIFGVQAPTFVTSINGKEVYFDLKKISDTQFVGTGLVDGTNIKRTMTYLPETMSFDVQTDFDVTPQNITFELNDIKHKVDSGNFLMPSFEKQDFLFKTEDKIKTEHISSVKEGAAFTASANLVSLAATGTQHFTQALVDKSDVSPSIQMGVQGNTVRLAAIYDLKNTKVSQIKNKLYIGPKQVDVLSKIDVLMPEVMDYGIFGFISKLLLSLMKFMYTIFGNWGLAIIALTLVMRILVLPFNILSFKSARAMQRIQPQLQAVREKYKSDPLAVNRESMALMKQNNANPLSSCLPMLIQIPIFFALWRTIGSSIEIYQQPFFGWITDLSAHDHFFILPILMGITMYLQQKMTPTTMDPAQQKILNFMPIIFSLFMLSLPSGLTLYNFISSLFGAIQQYFLLKEPKKTSQTTSLKGA
ncbi:MAG: membrane protein insertase YidC [Bdellovibrionaceae bacterium]|nr:membrane protein insertase YidC [Pseudobdellovibrionaceae bacterium]